MGVRDWWGVTYERKFKKKELALESGLVRKPFGGTQNLIIMFYIFFSR